jgi:hypothetical protein
MNLKDERMKEHQLMKRRLEERHRLLDCCVEGKDCRGWLKREKMVEERGRLKRERERLKRTVAEVRSLGEQVVLPKFGVEVVLVIIQLGWWRSRSLSRLT